MKKPKNFRRTFWLMSEYWPGMTGLPMYIWLDTCQEYKDKHHEIWVEFQINTHPEHELWNLCPMTLDGDIPEDKASILADADCDLDEEDLEQLQNFVLNNKVALKHLADGDISSFEFQDILIPGGVEVTAVRKRRQIREIRKIMEETAEYYRKRQEHENRAVVMECTDEEEGELLLEMANFPPKNNGTKMFMWVEGGDSYKRGGHGKRVKVQLNKDCHFQKDNCFSICLDGSIPDSSQQKLDDPKRCKLNPSDVAQAVSVVHYNSFLFDSFIDKFVSEEFLKANFIKYGAKNPDSAKAIVDDKLKKIIFDDPKNAARYREIHKDDNKKPKMTAKDRKRQSRIANDRKRRKR